MRLGTILLACLSLTVMAAARPEGGLLNLEKTPIGQLPPGWSAAKTGQGPGSVWKVVEDRSAPGGPRVLAQTSAEGPNPLFNLCIADRTNYQDLDLSVALKAVAGKIDQGGGPIWRCRDANNYYIARMNSLEDNFRIYKVVDGKRRQLYSAEIKAPPSDQWHTIRIVHQGKRIRCFLNGKPLIEIDDDTFLSPGKIGLWTKADAQTRFADLKIRAPGGTP